jgi:hypothetical protein
VWRQEKLTFAFAKSANGEEVPGMLSDKQGRLQNKHRFLLLRLSAGICGTPEKNLLSVRISPNVSDRPASELVGAGG